MIPLSVLDQSVATVGRPQGQAIRNTIELAKVCERLGYSRFWVSEHHSHGSIVGTAPEVLIAAIASQTSAIRVGSAGVMLPHYSALHVCEQFRVLDAIAPGRIDLGLGRAPGSDGRTAYALNPMANERPAQFVSDIRDILAWITGSPLSEGHPYAQVKCLPQDTTTPEVWILGSSDYGAQVAAHFGLPYAFAWFFTDGRGGREAIEIYKKTFKPSERFAEPHPAICVFAVVAETEAEAVRQYQSRARTRLLRDHGVFAELEPPDVAGGYDYTEAERARLVQLRQSAIVGTAAQVAEGIDKLVRLLGVKEVAVVTWAYDEEVRQESYRLLAKAMGLTPRAT
jgi:luciferase family oxidoreductase group 1